MMSVMIWFIVLHPSNGTITEQPTVTKSVPTVFKRDFVTVTTVLKNSVVTLSVWLLLSIMFVTLLTDYLWIQQLSVRLKDVMLIHHLLLPYVLITTVFKLTVLRQCVKRKPVRLGMVLDQDAETGIVSISVYLNSVRLFLSLRKFNLKFSVMTMLVQPEVLVVLPIVFKVSSVMVINLFVILNLFNTLLWNPTVLSYVSLLESMF